MTLPLLERIESLVKQGATVVGNAPKRSPSLQNYPQADQQVQDLAEKMWGKASSQKTVRPYGKGSIVSLPTNTASQQPMTFSQAKWIWYPEGNPAYDAPGGTRYFRKMIRIPDGHTVENARMIGTADNDLVVKINGEEIFKSNLSDPVSAKHFGKTLKQGDNLIEMEAINWESDQRNPAGLIAKFEIVSASPRTGANSIQSFSTDDRWEASQDGQTWVSAMILGDFGTGPWSIAVSKENSKEIYPDYEVTAKILAGRGVNVDFDATEKGLRFFHRQDGKADYYFVGNKTDQPFHGEVAFRVTGKQASIWDPLTGRIFKTPPTKTRGGMTSFLLDLDGSQSVFVVFDAKGSPPSSLVWQSRPQESILDLTDDWEVHFDANRGGPETPVTFSKLQDWSGNDLEGVKYYSGIATYKKNFTLSANDLKSGKRYWLDLGEVEVMAKVKLNGKEIGTCWVAPYKFEMTDALQTGENVLKVEVANLWPNRLIGDAKLPEEKRTTWTTLAGAYNADSPLLPSGLLGPVQVLKEK